MNSSLAAPRYDRLVILATFAALVLRFWGLGERSFWVDEIFTLEVITPGWEGLVQRAAALNDAPLFYLLVRPFHLLLGGEFGLRIFSALCGAATIPFVYQLGKTVFSSKVGLLAALFLAISPFHLWFSQEGRLYSLLILLWTASTLVFLQLKEKENLGRWVVYVILLALCLYTKVLSIFLFAAHFFIWLNLRRQVNWSAWKPFTAWFCAILLFAPIVPLLIQGLAEGGGSPRGPSLLELPYTLYSLVAGYSLGPSPSVLHLFSVKTAIKPYVFDFALAFIAFAPVSLLGLIALWKNKQARWTMLFWLAIPTALMILASIFVSKHSFNVRYVSPIVIPVLLIISLGTFSGGNSKRQKMLSGLVVAAMLYADFNHLFVEDYTKWDIRRAAIELNENEKEGDSAFIVDHGSVFEHYFKGDMPFRSIDLTYSLKRIEEQLRQQALRTEGRLWLVIGRWQQLDPNRYALTYCQENFQPTSVPVTHFDLVDIYCFQP